MKHLYKQRNILQCFQCFLKTGKVFLRRHFKRLYHSMTTTIQIIPKHKPFWKLVEFSFLKCSSSLLSVGICAFWKRKDKGLAGYIELVAQFFQLWLTYMCQCNQNIHSTIPAGKVCHSIVTFVQPKYSKWYSRL